MATEARLNVPNAWKSQTKLLGSKKQGVGGGSEVRKTPTKRNFLWSTPPQTTPETHHMGGNMSQTTRTRTNPDANVTETDRNAQPAERRQTSVTRSTWGLHRKRIGSRPLSPRFTAITVPLCSNTPVSKRRP